VAKDILDRNKLFGTGTPEDAKPGQSLTVNAQINTIDTHVPSGHRLCNWGS